MSTNEDVLKKLLWVSGVCLIFMTIEIVGGLIANSIAILSDAMHLFSDLAAFAISAYAVWLSKRRAPSHLTYGYHKAEVLGTLLNIAIIWIVTLVLFIEATERIIHRQAVEQPSFMLYTSILGLGCNIVMIKILHSDANFHHQGCSHDHKQHRHQPIEQDRQKIHHHHQGCNGHHSAIQMQPEYEDPSTYLQQTSNLNLEAAYVHILGDIILSIGVIISACIIYFTSGDSKQWTYYHLADPFCTYLFSILVIMTTGRITKKSIIILMDGCLDPGLIDQLKNQLSGKVYKDLRVWSINSNTHLASIRTKEDEKEIRKIFSKRNIDVVIGCYQ